MNLFYNFGRTMKDKYISDKFLQLAIKTEQYDEGIEIVKYYRGFLDHPPSRKTVYELLNKLVDANHFEESTIINTIGVNLSVRNYLLSFNPCLMKL